MLDIVKRQEGFTGIPEYSKLINQGVVPERMTTGAIYFHETDKKDIAQVCCDLYQQSPENSRVMAPTKALVTEINKLIQTAVNPNGAMFQFKMREEQLFMNLRLNDTILFTKNHVSALESASFFPKISSSHLKSITSSLDFHYDHSRTC